MRLTIYIPEEYQDALVKMCQDDLRYPKEQLIYLLREEIKRRDKNPLNEICPDCGSSNFIIQEEISYNYDDLMTAYDIVVCEECKKEWVGIYKFQHLVKNSLKR